MFVVIPLTVTEIAEDRLYKSTSNSIYSQKNSHEISLFCFSQSSGHIEYYSSSGNEWGYLDWPTSWTFYWICGSSTNFSTLSRFIHSFVFVFAGNAILLNESQSHGGLYTLFEFVIGCYFSRTVEHFRKHIYEI